MQHTKNLLFFFLGFTPCYLAAPPFTFSLKPRETACDITVWWPPSHSYKNLCGANKISSNLVFAWSTHNWHNLCSKNRTKPRLVLAQTPPLQNCKLFDCVVFPQKILSFTKSLGNLSVDGGDQVASGRVGSRVSLPSRLQQQNTKIRKLRLDDWPMGEMGCQQWHIGSRTTKQSELTHHNMII